MNRFFSYCIAFIWVTSTANAQVPALENSIFWEITGNDAKKPMYIFGTHHLHDYKFVENNAQIQEILSKTDAVFGEMVIDGNEVQMMMKMAGAMFMKGKTLNQLMSVEEFEATDKCLKETMGLSLATLNNVKPIFIYQLIMVAKFMKSQPQADQVPQLQGVDNSMDSYFQRKAKSLNKEVRGLETVDDQLKALYDGYSLERQVQMLLEMVRDKDGISTQEITTLNEFYNKQDLNGLLALMQKTATPEELQGLLVDRNNKWIPQLDTLLQSKKGTFIAVGAGHLPGEFGVLNQLKQKGYAIKPIKIRVE
jgi:hypothetical protein